VRCVVVGVVGEGLDGELAGLNASNLCGVGDS